MGILRRNTLHSRVVVDLLRILNQRNLSSTLQLFLKVFKTYRIKHVRTLTARMLK